VLNITPVDAEANGLNAICVAKVNAQGNKPGTVGESWNERDEME
jgi:hypothetical protein